MAKGRKDAVIFHTPVPGAQQSVFHTIYRWLIQERNGTVAFYTTLAVPTELFFIQIIGVMIFYSLLAVPTKLFFYTEHG
ncbi:hypothetical protein KKI93_03755 [Xenorhabdus bovienii]|uniref:hypothetical protein n=1 Tax=Xenorhabdus bovienii TaxID=40576 RepID=UPI0023B347C9|nr:hypothetical protein [Xenorhabdus bovienii]MDE9563207.1 hypothetical protein [Xenorhabdus bovienii]